MTQTSEARRVDGSAANGAPAVTDGHQSPARPG